MEEASLFLTWAATGGMAMDGERDEEGDRHPATRMGWGLEMAMGTPYRVPDGFYPIQSRVWDDFSTRGYVNG